MSFIDCLKRSGEGFMNSVEIHEDEGFVRKKFDNGFFPNRYSDFLSGILALTAGYEPLSGKNRKRIEAENYRRFGKHGVSVPELIKEGNT